MGSSRRSPARSRERRRHRDHKHRHRSRSSERSHRHSRREHSSRERSHRHERSPSRHDHSRRDRRDHSSDRPTDLKGSYANNFSSGGRIHEDNGGLPLPASHQGHLDSYQEDPSYQYAQYGSGLQEGGYNGQAGGPYPSINQHPRSQGHSDQHEEQYPDQFDYGRPNRSEQYHQGYQNQRQGYRGREPSSSLHIRGIPDEYDEADINRLFSGFSGVEHVRIVRDRGSGQSRGFGFVVRTLAWHVQGYFADDTQQAGHTYGKMARPMREFDSVESAQQIMESDLRFQFNLDGASLRLDYSHAAQPPAAVSASQSSDWICPGCSAVNFSRRLECYRCCVAKPAHAATVTVQPDAPSHILKISGLEPHTSEGSLYKAIAQHSTVKDIRLVLDKFTGTPRGFAFVHFHSVADASRVLHALQNVVIDGQETPLRLSFAKDKPTDRPPPTSTIASDALQAAQAMSQYAGWEPQVFSDAQPSAQPSTWQPQEFNNAQDPAAQQTSVAPGTVDPKMQWQQHQGQQPAADWQQGQGSGQNTGQVPPWQPSQEQGQGQSYDGQQQQQWQQQQPGQAPGTIEQDQGHVEWSQSQPDGVQTHQQQQAWPPPDQQQPQQWQHEQQHLQQQPQAAPGTEVDSATGQLPVLSDPQSEQQLHQQTGQQQGQGQPPSAQQNAEGNTTAQAGFVYDSASGYWHDAASGYYYDANTGLYCHPQTQQWYSQDAATGEFTPCVSEQGISSAGANALESTTAAVATAQAVEPLHAPEVTIKPAVKKKGAVIGSAPKLSHEGLVAAAKAAEEKAAAEKRALQLAAKKAAAAEAKANRKKPKLAAPGGGIGFQGKPAQTSAVTPGVPEGPTATGVTVTDDLGGQTPVVDPVSVQGKIYQGKWSRKKQ